MRHGGVSLFLYHAMFIVVEQTVDRILGPLYDFGIGLFRKATQVRGFSHQRFKVLKAFYDDEPTSELSGADIMRLTGLGSGSVYPILVVFEERRALVSRWEADEPQALGRPRRRLYRLTDLGVGLYKEALADVTPTRDRVPSLRPSEA